MKGLKPSKHRYLEGFTLIEILIALMIFAILATITSSTLYYAFNTRSRVMQQAKRLSALQLSISLIQKDCLQILDRASRVNDMQLAPAFVGQTNYFEFTRDGNINPSSMEKRSSLKRMGLFCINNQLIHRTWASLDPIDVSLYEDKVLVDNLSACHFKYLNQNSQVLAQWRAQALTQNQKKEPLPKAILLNLILKDWGEMNLLFIIPGGLYVANEI